MEYMNLIVKIIKYCLKVNYYQQMISKWINNSVMKMKI